MAHVIKLKVASADGTLWAVPAEIVPSKFKRHQFAVHKSIALEDDTWVVTHIDSSFAVARGGNKEQAIEAAKAALSTVKADRFQEMVDEAMAKKPRVSVGELVRTLGII